MSTANSTPAPPTQGGAEPQWWGDFAFEVGVCRRWQVGPLTLFIHRKVGHWDLRHAQGPNWAQEGGEVAALVNEASLPGGDLDGRRVGTNASDGHLTLAPALPDRPVVTRPEFEFLLPPEQTVTLYVSTPLFLMVRSDEGRQTLLDIPTWRLSDTWFGIPTRGELCYASRTTCQQDPNALLRRGNRAITPVVIRNLAPTPQRLDRIALPLPRLGLYLGEDGRIWTQGLTLERGKDGDLSRGRREPGAPRGAGEATLIAEPRMPSEDFFLTRAFQELFTREAIL